MSKYQITIRVTESQADKATYAIMNSSISIIESYYQKSNDGKNVKVFKLRFVKAVDIFNLGRCLPY